VADVRTQAEYADGHMAGAFNIPIFSNEERAEIGTIYKHAGREAAILAGFTLTGPKWADLIREAERIAPDKHLLVYCWRGGMRSGAMAWAFDLYGFNTSVLKNGYKAYRKAGIEAFGREYPFVVLSGYTGTGKTRTLQEMKKLGEQVIDLEDLAQHQGSAFGSKGIMNQPGQEQFENLLAAELLKMDPGRRIWIEDESASLGKRVIPGNLFRQLSLAPVIRLDIPLEERHAFLNEEYGRLDKAFLIGSVERIAKRLGGLATKTSLLAIEEGRIGDFIAEVLVYYDKTYLKGQSKREPSAVHPLALTGINPPENAKRVIDFYGY
jgi:tRNA 2-selenouridine synthase